MDKEMIEHNSRIVRKKLFFAKRKGIKRLISRLEELGFFTAKASNLYHSNFEGGLVEHSLQVYHAFRMLINKANIKEYELSRVSLIIVALLHDVCKCMRTKRHAESSINLIKSYITLKPIEEEMIRYHMGFYGTIEFSRDRGEYKISELALAFENPMVKLFYFADDYSAQFLETVTKSS